MPHPIRILCASAPAAIAMIVAACQPGSASRTAAAPAPVPACTNAVATADTLPSPCLIMDRHVARIGGRDVIEGIGGVRYHATLEYPAAGITAELTAWSARPNRVVVRATVPGIGEIANGFDGTVGWSLAPTTGPRLLEGSELATARENADFEALAKRASRYASLETVGRTVFEGRPAWHLRLVLRSGREVEEYYDVETELQIGSVSTQETVAMRARITTILEDYRAFGPLLLPAREIQRLPGGQQTVLTRDAVHFEDLPDSVFALPAEIRALVGR